jgi:hypothetical protein
MAPGQAASPKDLTAAADIYALGAVLMFAMTGRYPYERPTVPALLLALTDPATDPDLTGLPEEIKLLLTGMLAHHSASPGPPWGGHSSPAEDSEERQVGRDRIEWTRSRR